MSWPSLLSASATGYTAEINTVLADAHDRQVSGFKKFVPKPLKMMLST